MSLPTGSVGPKDLRWTPVSRMTRPLPPPHRSVVVGRRGHGTPVRAGGLTRRHLPPALGRPRPSTTRGVAVQRFGVPGDPEPLTRGDVTWWTTGSSVAHCCGVPPARPHGVSQSETDPVTCLHRCTTGPTPRHRTHRRTGPGRGIDRGSFRTDPSPVVVIPTTGSPVPGGGRVSVGLGQTIRRGALLGTSVLFSGFGSR